MDLLFNQINLFYKGVFLQNFNLNEFYSLGEIKKELDQFPQYNFFIQDVNTLNVLSCNIYSSYLLNSKNMQYRNSKYIKQGLIKNNWALKKKFSKTWIFLITLCVFVREIWAHLVTRNTTLKCGCLARGENGAYGEVTSVSNFKTFQARRLNITYIDENGKKQYVNTLNGTAIALTRVILAIMENYQQAYSSIKIPEVLQKYIGFDTISKK